MNETLMHLLVQNLVFLELSDDSVLDPDAAVRQMESIGNELQNLDEAEKRELIDYLERCAINQELLGAPAGTVEFIRSVPEAFGLLESEG